MYPVNNNVAIYNINLNENIQSICNYITSRLKDLKDYILQLFKKDTNQYFEDYYSNYNKLQSILESYEEFDREDIALYRINKYIEYIFKNKKLTLELVDFIYDIWDLFTDLMKLKLDSMNDNNSFSNEDYEIKYKQYRKKIRKYEHYYYTNIHQPTCDCEDLATQIGNILMD